MSKIHVLQAEISVHSLEQGDFISLSDMARFKDPTRSDYIIQNWLRNRTTIEFLGIWEQLNNPAFKSIEFDGFKTQAGLDQSARLVKLNQIAIHQMRLLVVDHTVKAIEDKAK